MAKSGAMLTIYALEQIGVRKTFGIPGASNAGLYDGLFKSAHIEPIVVSSELSAGYMADAVSRTTDSIGAIVIADGSGISHAMCAIGQAKTDGIPMLIISGSNIIQGKDHQINNINSSSLLESTTKGSFKIKSGEKIIQTIYKAYDLAITGEPGPVHIDIPLEIQNNAFTCELMPYQRKDGKKVNSNNEKETDGVNLFASSDTSEDKLDQAVRLISSSNHPGLYVGWGALGALDELVELSEMLSIPVSTSLQGIGVFPSNHPLHVGFGFGSFAVPAAKKAFENCDCLIAVGVRFSELATAGYTLPVPGNLIHININPNAFHSNYHAKIALTGDSKEMLISLVNRLKEAKIKPKNNFKTLTETIQQAKNDFLKSWLKTPNEEAVSPGFFFNALRNHLPDESIVFSDGANHRFHVAELFPVQGPRQFICTTGSNAPAYAIPATIGAKLLNRSKIIAALISENSLIVNGFELMTALNYKLGVIVFVIRDSNVLLSEKNETLKNPARGMFLDRFVDIEKFSQSVHAEYFIIKNDIDISGVLSKSKEVIKSGKNAVVELVWDTSRKPVFLSGSDKVFTSRYSFLEKIKMMFKHEK